MKKAQHTPGPWGFEEKTDADGFGVTKIFTSWGFYLAELTGYKKEERQANARLIAAAPELLEALEGMLAIEHTWTGGMKSLWPDKARAAIAKARGQS